MNLETSTTGSIFNIQRFSVNDGPGIRTTVFLKGCPLACVWCHNPESQTPQPNVIYRRNRCICCGECAEHCPENAIAIDDGANTDLDACIRCGTCVDHCYTDAREIAGRDMDSDELMETIEKDRPFFEQSNGGVTLSGGEPLAQAEFARTILKACQLAGIHTALDTCGYANWHILAVLSPYVDLFLFVLKLMDDGQHRRYAGVSNRLILKNLKKLAHQGHRIIIRFPIIPGITDDDANVKTLATFTKPLPSIQRIDILPYHHIAVEKYERLSQHYHLGQCHPPTKEKLKTIKQMLQRSGVPISIGG